MSGPTAAVQNGEKGDQVALAVGELVEIQRELRSGRSRVIAVVLKVELEDPARLAGLGQFEADESLEHARLSGRSGSRQRHRMTPETDDEATTPGDVTDDRGEQTSASLWAVILKGSGEKT